MFFGFFSEDFPLSSGIWEGFWHTDGTRIPERVRRRYTDGTRMGLGLDAHQKEGNSILTKEAHMEFVFEGLIKGLIQTPLSIM